VNNKYIKWAVFALAFFGAAAIIKYARIGYEVSGSLNSLEAQMQKGAAEELKINPEQSKTEATMAAATKVGNADLANTKTTETKIEKAADQYLGFYAMNTVLRPKFCERLGVPIPLFVAAFKRVNAEETRIASVEWAKQKESPDALIKVITPTLMPYLEQDMADITKSLNLSTSKQSCQVFEAKGDILGANMSVEKRNPVLYAALHGQ
jgi:hypothetical protein